MKKRVSLSVLCSCLLLGCVTAQKAKDAFSFSVSAARMNVLYVGVKNTVLIDCYGISPESIDVQVSGGTLLSLNSSSKTAFATILVDTLGEVAVNISPKGGPLKATHFFRTKCIPDPVPALGAKHTRSDTMSAGEFKAQRGITLLLENFDFDVKCEMIEYKVTLISHDHVTGELYLRSVKNKGVRFSEEALDIIYEAHSGDIFIFSEIKGRCPGDVKDRDLNALVIFMEKSGDD